MKVLTLNEEGLRMAARRLADVMVLTLWWGYVGEVRLSPMDCRKRCPTVIAAVGGMWSYSVRQRRGRVTDSLQYCVECRYGCLIPCAAWRHVCCNYLAVARACKGGTVDDAIDSGVTIRVVCDALQERYGMDAVIKTAVVTVTTDAPLLDADFYCYHDHTLVRFPWSMDYKR